MRRLHHLQRPAAEERRGVVLLLTAVLLVTIFGFVTFSVDYGYMSMAQGGLQNAADSAALAAVVELGDGEGHAIDVAEDLAAANAFGSFTPDVRNARTQAGIFDLETKTFFPTSVGPNAIRVRAEMNDVPLFFGPVIGHDDFSGAAEAIAMTKPREIVLVVDLSSSMNNDTEPVESPWEIRDAAASRGLADPNIGFDLLQDLWDDLNFGTYPGQLEMIGEGLPKMAGRTRDRYGWMTYDYADLRYYGGIDPWYDYNGSSSEWTRKRAAYRWIIDKQLARLMPEAKPFPDSRNASSYAHYEKYLDFVITRDRWYRSHGRRQGRSSGSVWIPHGQHWWRMSDDRNPDTGEPFRDRVGYQTYVEWIIGCGRDRRPSNNYSVHSGLLTELSLDSPFAKTHSEDVNGETYQMPPRLYPMHSCRRSLIRACQQIRDKNAGISASVADRVAVVSFDATDQGRWPEVVVPLTTDYDAAALACSKLQIVGKNNSGGSTSAQIALDLAAELLEEQSQGGPSRNNSERVMIFLSDGAPNLRSISNGQINSYIGDNPHDDFYGSGEHRDPYKMNAPLVSAHKLRAMGVHLFGVGMGVGVDYGYMDRLSRIAGTDKAGVSERTSGDPLEYERSISAILDGIIKYAGVSLVQ